MLFAFALELFQQLRSTPGNVVVAPRNAIAALTLIRGNAAGQTAREIDAALRGEAGPRDANVVDASALWGGREPIDVARINAWVRKATNGKIDAVVAPGMLTPQTRLILTTATYMKAQWEQPFDPGDTRPAPFHLAGGGEVRVPMMKEKLWTSYAAVGSVRLLELPYTNKGLSMLIVLPKERDGLPAVERALTPALLAKWTRALKAKEDIELHLPRFHGATEGDLRSPLQKLGVRRVFDSHRARLPGLKSDQPLYLSSILQKVRIDVDEAGTEASAAAAGSFVILSTAIPPPPKPFIADHPFLYIIRSHGRIVFLGRVADPR